MLLYNQSFSWYGVLYYYHQKYKVECIVFSSKVNYHSNKSLYNYLLILSSCCSSLIIR